MPANLETWRRTVEQAVSAIADKDMQRRAWFGIGPEESSPDEVFNQFFDDAEIEEFIRRDDNRLSPSQAEAGLRLVTLMRELSLKTPPFVEPSTLIDDPRWIEIRKSAAHFLYVLGAS